LFVTIIVTGLTVSLTAYFVGKQQERNQILDLFTQTATDASNLLQATLNNTVPVLNATSLFFTLTNGSASLEQFQSYATVVQLESPAFYGVFYVAVVPSDELNSFNQKERIQYPQLWPSVGVFQLKSNATSFLQRNRVSVSRGPVYYPFQYAYPLEENRYLLGFDVAGSGFTNPLSNILNDRQPSSTNKFFRVDSSGFQTTEIAVAVLIPTLALGNQTDVIGFSVGFLAISNLVEQISAGSRDYLSFALFEQHPQLPDDAFLYCSNCNSSDINVPDKFKEVYGYRTTHNLTLLNTEWEFVAVPSSQLVSSQETFLPEAFSITILVIMAIALVFLGYNIHQYQKALKLIGKL